ncbi:MAG: insulinase family protein [Woeseia sp.]
MRQQHKCGIAAVWLMVLCGGTASAGLDLRNASVERLDNGLTVILLEDRNFPVVSTQMLYRVGARDESYGQTGIAHFLEHMAFRSSDNFPDTGLVSSIYAAGGEWHGYTWTDQTTYFSTVPKEHLDLLLRIEADRIARLRIAREDMEAERGAVLAEMHMYENYPTSMLLDAILFTSFQAHPYRNNTIGWESDIENLTHKEVVAFYERHYQPANAVLAVVGDFDREKVRRRIEKLFGGLKGRAPTPLPHTIEPLQKGERRVRLYADTSVKRFMIGYRAPAASDPDFPAFLVLEAMLGASSGVNFRQNDWGTSARDESLLHGVADEVTTWYPPSAQDYVLIVGGTIPADGDETALEQAIESRIANLRDNVPEDAVAAAIGSVLDELVYDVETTEDAAHQLAFFDGLNALERLLELPRRVEAVTATDVQRVARRWLLPQRRTIGWHVPGEDRAEAQALVERPRANSVDKGNPEPLDTQRVPPPEVRRLRGGIPVIVQPSDVSPSGWLQLVMPGNNTLAANALSNNPVRNHSSLVWRFRAGELAETVRMAQEALRAGSVAKGEAEADSKDPETRLEQVFDTLMSSASAGAAPPVPALIVVSGDVDAETTFDLLERSFGDSDGAVPAVQRAQPVPGDDIEINLGRPVAQAQLGYVVAAPGPDDATSGAWQILRYILSHDYEGRLGKEAISNRGLAYYIDSRYRSDGENGWVTLSVGVDPDKVAALKALLESELERLEKEPPLQAEIDEARQHLVGRHRSSAQSNEELARARARDWLWYGEVLTPDALARKLDGIDRDDVLEVIPQFIDGAMVVIEQ